MALKRKKKKKAAKYSGTFLPLLNWRRLPLDKMDVLINSHLWKDQIWKEKFQLSSWDGGSTDTLWEGSGPLPSRVGGHTPALMVYSPQHASWLLKRSFCIQDFLQMEGLKMLHCRLHNVCDNRDNYRSTAARPKMVTAFFSVPIIKLIRNLMRI